MRILVAGAAGEVGRQLLPQLAAQGHQVTAAAIAALDRGEPGVCNVVDNEPASVGEWLPFLAQTVGATQQLGWEPAWPSWRQGFRDGLRE